MQSATASQHLSEAPALMDDRRCLALTRYDS
jgi:hypothetical protein